MLRLFLLLVLAVMVGCASGPPKRMEAPLLQLQELQPSGSDWVLHLRLRNRGNFTIEVDALELSIELDGHQSGPVRQTSQLDIPSFSTETLTLSWSPSAAQRLALQRLADGETASLEYRLTGATHLSVPRRSFDFETRAFLTPTPGKADSYR